TGGPGWDVSGQADGRAAIRNACTGHPNSHSVFVGDFFRGGCSSVFVQINANNVSALLHDSIGDLLANPRSGADDSDDLPRQLLFRGHALELRLLQEPVLDVKGFLLRQSDV